MSIQLRLVAVSENKTGMAWKRNKDSRIVGFGLVLKLGGGLIYCL